MGITRRRGYKTKCENIRYFENIDTPQKAYFLGLLSADGCVLHNAKNGENSYTIRLELKLEDKYIIEEFRNAIQSSNLVKEYEGITKSEWNGKSYTSKKHNAYFSIGSYEMAQDLIKWGCSPKKETHIKIPDIPKELIRYYILGYFDGDGVVSVGKSTYIGFVGRLPILKSITNTLEQETGVPAPNIYYNRFNHIYFVQYRNAESQNKLYHYFYEEIEIPHLLRKHNKLKEALNM